MMTEMNRKGGIRGMALLLCLVLCMLAGSAAAERAWIDGRTSDRVHLRSGPSTYSNSQGLFFTGTPVEVMEERGDGWSRVQVGHQQGYIMSQFLTFWDGNQGGLKAGTVIGSGYLNLRIQPSQDAECMNRLWPGQRLILLGETSNHWYLVRVPNSAQVGYVMTRFVQMDGRYRPVPSGGSQVIRGMAFSGGAAGKRFTDVVVDRSADGFVLEWLQGASNVSIDKVEWHSLDEPVYTPVYTADYLPAGAAIHVWDDLMEVMPAYAVSCRCRGIDQTWYVMQSGRDDGVLLVEASDWNSDSVGWNGDSDGWNGDSDGWNDDSDGWNDDSDG